MRDLPRYDRVVFGHRHRSGWHRSSERGRRSRETVLRLRENRYSRWGGAEWLLTSPGALRPNAEGWTLSSSTLSPTARESSRKELRTPARTVRSSTSVTTGRSGTKSLVTGPGWTRDSVKEEGGRRGLSRRNGTTTCTTASLTAPKPVTDGTSDETTRLADPAWRPTR